MLDTKPDLSSYVWTARRRWWLFPLLAVLLAVAAMASPRSDAVTATAIVNIPDAAPLATSLGADAVSLFNPIDLAVLVGEDLAEADPEVGAWSTSVVSGRPTVDLEIEVEGEEQLTEQVETVDAALAQSWQDRLGDRLGPLEVRLESEIAAASQRLSELGDSPAEELEAIRLNERIIGARATLDGTSAVLATPPSVELVGDPSQSGTNTIVAAAAFILGLFLAAGVVVALTLGDHRLRRRSMAERNGLTVACVARSPEDPVLHSIAPTIRASTGLDHPALLVVAATDEVDPTGLDFGDGVHTTTTDGSMDNLIELVGQADSVVVATRAGKSDLRDVHEMARSISAMGGKNLCLALLAPGSAYREALD